VQPVARAALLVQGTYYVLTGVWPLVAMWSFELVTGPKTDDWLVRMVGLLAASIGLTLLAAARRRRVTPEVRLLAVASALSFAAIDLVYALTGRISAVYLLDAAVELLLAAAVGLTRGAAPNDDVPRRSGPGAAHR
jgi:hypothetical protein